ncbi:MAG: hypothetical protein KA500_01255 [Rhodoluna sp.]|nr:hypothetical protein [Rhodoluna sp.]
MARSKLVPTCLDLVIKRRPINQARRFTLSTRNNPSENSVSLEASEEAVIPKVESTWPEKKIVFATTKAPDVTAATNATPRCATVPNAEIKIRLTTTVSPLAPGLQSSIIAQVVAKSRDAMANQGSRTENSTATAKKTETKKLLKPEVKRSVPPKTSRENAARSELDCHL